MGGEHNFCLHNDTDTWFHGRKKKYEKIIITEAHKNVYKKVRKEIIKFVKNCYLKDDKIKEFIDKNVPFSFSENDFNINGLTVAHNIEDFYLSPSWRDPHHYLLMMYDIAKLLCLTLPGIFCVYFDRSNYHGDFAEYRSGWEDGKPICKVKFTKIPFFNFYKIPDLNSDKKFINAETYNSNRLEGRLPLDSSEFINKLSQPYKTIKFDYRIIKSRKIYLTHKQRLIISFLACVFPIDVVDIICDPIYQICQNDMS